MKRTARIELSVAAACIFVLQFTPAMAAKPLDVIALSNGYPSGPHYNLNIHGKTDYTCDTTLEGGNSVFISEYGESTISYVTNRKSSVTELVALDQCAEDFDGDPAKVQIPYEPMGYYVFGAIKGKPNNGNTAEASSILLSPNLVTGACNDTDPANPEFPTYTECQDDDLLTLGMIVGDNLYEATDVGFVRFDASSSTGKGKSKAKDMTDFFLWTGWVYDGSLDTNLDGAVTIEDVPLGYDLITVDNIIDDDEYTLWLGEQMAAGLAAWYENEWILNIADLVATDQVVNNDGTKLFKIRFYPVETTEYVAPIE